MMKGDVIVALLLAAGSTSCIQPVTLRPSQPTTPVSDEVQSLISLINNHRRSIGCPVLAWNSTVARVAQAHSDDMVRRRYFSHNTPEGQTSGQRLDAAGVIWTRVAENIAAGQPTARDVYQSWLSSSGHRANIENCVYREHGIGLTRGSATGAVTNAWTHDFVTLR